MRNSSIYNDINNETADDRLLNDQNNETNTFENFYNNFEVNDDTQCGIWIFHGDFLQKFASKKTFAIIYGISSCVHSATFSYFNGTISTIEKVLKVSSKTMGMISSTSNICQMLLTILMSYYISKQHKPRWLAIGLMTTVLFSFFNVLPFLLYGPSEDSLLLTEEYADDLTHKTTLRELLRSEPKSNLLCSANRTLINDDCNRSVESKINYMSTLLLLLAQFIGGFGGSLISSIGITYMDDNAKKSSAPLLIGLSFFLRLIGPATGLNIASLCLSYYVAPNLHPTIDRKDPRWIGAWWMGWFILGIPMIFMAFTMSMFPKHLPRAYARQKFHELKDLSSPKVEPSVQSSKNASWIDFKQTIKRLITNKIFIINNMAMVCFVFSFIPSTIFVPKYLEVQFKISQAQSNFFTGFVSLIFAACGTLISSLVITKFKSKARHLSMWNIFTSLLSCIAILSYAFIGCEQNELSLTQMKNYSFSCDITACHCDFVRYSPICGVSNNVTFISPCHAGCTNEIIDVNGSRSYTDCSCVPIMADNKNASPGSCPIDCSTALYMFIAILALQKFLNGTSGSTNFLISIRSIDPRDKAVSIGITNLMISLLAFVPGPLLFGHMFDSSCEVWGKTCSGKGNCWLYETKQLRKNIFFLASGIRACTLIFDMIVWYLIKNVNIFDEKEKKPEENKSDN